MKQERFSEEKIVGILREAEKGEKPVADLCREQGIAEQTFYRWRRKYGGLDTSDVQRLKELTSENARLKRREEASRTRQDASVENERRCREAA